MLSLWRFLAVLAALFLAAGVALAAYAAHMGEARLATASQFLMMQGGALLGGLAAIATGHAAVQFGRLALAAASLGTILFCGDLALRGFDRGRLFPMAAPAGGVLMIGGWLAFALAALFRKS
jgi:uncharacterized membrane protein YgdD (TMEM256/DUF423 family)